MLNVRYGVRLYAYSNCLLKSGYSRLEVSMVTVLENCWLVLMRTAGKGHDITQLNLNIKEVLNK